MINVINDHLVTATVTEIRWERIIAHIYVKVEFSSEADKEIPLDFYAVNGMFNAKAIFKSENKGEGIYHLSINYTNPGNALCLPGGTYRIIVCQNKNIVARCNVQPELTPKLENLSRNFLYSNRGAVYTVTFVVQEGENDLPLIMHVLSARKTGMSFPSNPKFKVKITTPQEYKKKNSKAWLRSLYAFLRKNHKRKDGNKKVILFMSEQSETLGSNLISVYDCIKKRGLEKEFVLLTSARMASSQRQSQKSWIELIRKLAMSDMVFLDDHAPVLDWLKLSDDTEVIQLWHAGAGFKSSGYSRWGHEGCPKPVSAHRQYKYGIAGSKNIAHFFSEVWGINDENVLPTGMPRIDEFLDEKYREQKTEDLYNQFPISKEKKVILFAPTYRGRSRKDAHYPYELIDFERLYELCGDEYVVFFKMHPWVSMPVPIEEKYTDKFFDVGTYPNINDLFYITELLITDYSSNIFEFSLMKKPMLFFAFDKIQYSFSRGFHREYELSAPGKVCYTFDELLRAIQQKDFEYEKVEEYVAHHFDYIDSHACDRVIDWIIFGNIPEDIVESIRKREQQQETLESLDFSVLEEKSDDEDDEDDEEIQVSS